MMTLKFRVLSFIFGFFIPPTLSSLSEAGSSNENFGSYHQDNAPEQHSFSLPLLESIVDSRFKLLAVNFQNQIDNLKGKVIKLESSKTSSKDQTEHGIQKRHADSANSSRRVCENSSSFCTYFHPDHPDAGRKRGSYSPTVPIEMVKEAAKVKGIPTSCEDLQRIGHKLNGVHLIKTSRPNQGVKIEAVYCDFHSFVNISVSQYLIGSVKTTTKDVFFYAQRNSAFGQFNAIIPFQLERLNEGGAFDLASGVFTAPVPGIYHFEFHAVKDGSTSYLDVILQLNGRTFAAATTGVTGSMDTLSLSSTLRLKAKDRVNLFNWKNGNPYPTSYLFDMDHLHLTHFGGWLMKEDLM